MTDNEYNNLKPGDKVYSYNIYNSRGIISPFSLNSVVEEDEICEPWFKNPSLGFSFCKDTTHLCLDNENKFYYFIDKQEALENKVNSIRLGYISEFNDKDLKDRIKKFFTQKNIAPIIFKNWPELLV